MTVELTVQDYVQCLASTAEAEYFDWSEDLPKRDRYQALSRRM